MYLVKMGVQIAIRPTWAFQEVPPEGGAFWRKQPRGRGAEQKGSTLLVSEIHLKLVRKIVSVKKIQAEALP